jgi:hypothetical protein
MAVPRKKSRKNKRLPKILPDSAAFTIASKKGGHRVRPVKRPKNRGSSNGNRVDAFFNNPPDHSAIHILLMSKNP